jgi:hypothetical protein
MRRQCYLVKIGAPRVYTHINKSDNPARFARRNARKKAEAAYIAKLVKAQTA